MISVETCFSHFFSFLSTYSTRSFRKNIHNMYWLLASIMYDNVADSFECLLQFGNDLDSIRACCYLLAQSNWLGNVLGITCPQLFFVIGTGAW